MTPTIDQSDQEFLSLQRALRQANGNDHVHVIGWDASALQPGLGAAAGGITLYTVMLAGKRAVEIQTLIRKVIKAGPPDADPTAWNYWRREPLVYTSGLLANLPDGLAAPACYAIDEQPDGSIWIWLEDIEETATIGWTMDRFSLAARHLGRLSGQYRDADNLPNEPWLSRRTLASWISPHLDHIDRVTTAREDPVVGPYYDERIAGEASRLGRQYIDILEALDRLPQAFQHGDAHKGNMFRRRNANGREETVLIDWAFAGVRAIGEELESFVSVASMFFNIEHDDIDRLSDAALEGYVEGLRDTGWNGDPDIVRLGYLGAAALRFTLVPIEVYAMNAGTREWLCTATGKPFDETMRRYQDVRRWGFQQEPTARELMRRLL